MLTMERVTAIYRLLDVILYMYKEKVGAVRTSAFSTNMSAMNNTYIIESDTKLAWSVILRDSEDDWFIASVHPDSEPGCRRRWNAFTNKTQTNQMTCTFCTNAPSALNHGEKDVVMHTLPSTVVDEGDIFSLQTLYEDCYVLCLVIEAYLRNKIEEEFYIPLNIDKLMKMEVYHIEAVTQFWEEYIDAHEEMQ